MKVFKEVLTEVKIAVLWSLAGALVLGGLVAFSTLGTRESWDQAGPVAKLAVVALVGAVAYLVGRFLRGRRHEQDGPPEGNQPWH